MKYFLYFFTLAAAFTTFNCQAMLLGQVDMEIIDGNMISWSSLNWAMSEQNYTNSETDGACTFTYPDSAFTAPPIAFITVNDNSSHDSDQIYTAEVTSNNENSAVVTAYLTTSEGTTEAATGSVSISLIAYGN